MKETYERDLPKRPTMKLTRAAEALNVFDMSFCRWKRLIKETYKRDLWKRPTQETYKIPDTRRKSLEHFRRPTSLCRMHWKTKKKETSLSGKKKSRVRQKGKIYTSTCQQKKYERKSKKPCKRDLYTSKEPCKRDLDTWKEVGVVCIRSRCVVKRPANETLIHQKSPAKETYAPENRPICIKRGLCSLY